MQVAPEQVPGLGQSGNQPAPSTEPVPQQQPQQQQGQGEPSYSLASEFLKSVPENQRPLFEPVIKQWDAQVTKKFQELHSQYEPYKELGAPPEILQQAMQIYQVLDQNPKAVYDMLAQEFGQQQQAPTTEQGPIGTTPEEYEGIPPEFVARMNKQEEVIQSLAEFVLKGHEDSQFQQEDAQLASYLDGLKQQHGEFDEDWVLVKISQGMDGEKAVQAWQNMIQNHVNQAGSGQQTPPILSGGGVVPQESFNPADIPSKDVKKLVAGLMQNIQAEGS